MEKRILGKTGIEVTAFGYGAMAIRTLPEGEVGRLLNTLLDNGITYIDTSPDYDLSETLIGKTIAHRRNEYILASKCGCNHTPEGKHLDPPHIWSRARLLDNIENSLRTLKTDHLDVWQLHSPSPVDLAGGAQGEVLQTMLDVKKSGKVRAIGVSYANSREGNELYPAGFGYKYIREFIGYGFDVMQIVYGGLTRLNENAISRAAEHGIGIIVRGVVKNYFDNYPDLFARAGLKELCEPGEGMSQFLIRYALAHPGLHTMIIGTSSPAHLIENINAASKGKLPTGVYEEAKRRLDAAGIRAGAY